MINLQINLKEPWCVTSPMFGTKYIGTYIQFCLDLLCFTINCQDKKRDCSAGIRNHIVYMQTYYTAETWN